MYLRNAWYVACTPDEIAAGPLGRTICGDRIVLFRAEGGNVSALEDFCPHRGAPLSLGTVREDGRIVCGYHGLVMGGDGKCVGMPGQRVRPTIKSYPALERYGFVWVWPGEKSLADPSKLHHLAWAESPAQRHAEKAWVWWVAYRKPHRAGAGRTSTCTKGPCAGVAP